jgi:hypothetical protein
LARRFAVGRRIVAFVGYRRPRRYIGTNIEQRFEISAVARLAACKMKTDGKTFLVCF